jgi:hypothetical protein
MTPVVIFRTLYLLTVVIGVIAAGRELVRARWLYRNLVKRRINGSRQALADHFVRTSAKLVAAEALLLVPSTGAFFVQGFLPPALPARVIGIIVCSQIAYMGVAAVLANRAISGYRDRLVLMNALDKDVEKAGDLA